eukprot:GEMP01022103.1.p1 GENE.GEMP01022103.1~~GEMP01022103.1.p1  ORF type:complete len:603 (+),score=127.97 GEMP01022103.1:28-1836(+)
MVSEWKKNAPSAAASAGGFMSGNGNALKSGLEFAGTKKRLRTEPAKSRAIINLSDTPKKKMRIQNSPSSTTQKSVNGLASSVSARDGRKLIDLRSDDEGEKENETKLERSVEKPKEIILTRQEKLKLELRKKHEMMENKIREARATLELSTATETREVPAFRRMSTGGLSQSAAATAEDMRGRLETAANAFDCDNEQLEILEKYVCSKLRGLTEPVGKLEKVSNVLRDKIQGAATRKENLCCIIRGHPRSGKKLMVNHALKGLDNIIPVHCIGNARETVILQQIANQLNPVTTNRMETFTQFKKWFCDVIKKRAATKQTLCLVIDHFEDLCVRSKQQLLYTLLDGMHKKQFRLIIIGITCDGNIVMNLEKRIRSRARFVPFELPTVDRRDLSIILKAHLGLGSDSPKELGESFKSAYNKLAMQRIHDFITNNRDSLKLQLAAGNQPLIQAHLDRCFPIRKLIEGTFDRPVAEDLNSLSEVGILICLAMMKMHDRECNPIKFEGILWELRPLWENARYTGRCVDPAVYMQEFRHLISRGIVVRAPVPSSFSLVPEQPLNIALAPVTLSYLLLMRRYVRDVKKEDPSNPAHRLPGVVCDWCTFN